VPLSAVVWSSAVFDRTVTNDRLVSAIVTDRRAALVAHSLAALDDDTLEYLAAHPDVLRRLYDRDAVAFGAFGSTLRISGGQVIPPGGEAAVPLWEALFGVPLQQPDRVLRVLYGDYGGRLAYIYDLIAQLDAPRAAFALGLWIDDSAVRATRLQALLNAVVSGYPEWRLDMLPFSKPLHDVGILLVRMEVEPNGAPAGIASEGFWADVFESQSLPGDRDLLREAPQDRTLDAAWLASATDTSHSFTRGERLDQFAFGQRVFGAASPATWGDVLVAIRAFPRQRMLMLTLERMGVRVPAVYAAVARATARVTANEPNRSFWTLSQLQGAVAIVAKMARGNSIDLKAAEALLLAAVKVPIDGDRYNGRFMRWIDNELVPLLPAGEPGSGVEGRILAGLAGRPAGRAAPRVRWEGLEYRLDLAAAERHRLTRVREKQGGYSVDLAVALDGVVRTLSAPAATIDAAKAAASRLANLQSEFGLGLRRTASTVLPPGVEAPREALEVIDRASQELARAIAAGDVRRAARVAGPLAEFLDIVLGDALLSIAYAAEMGDPDGSALLGSNVALRHDYGFRYRDGDVRLRSYWGIPRQDFLPGVPWHVAGSLLGLEIALAPFSLQRLTLDRGVEMPLIPSAEREALAIGVKLLDPRALTADGGTLIAAALRAGRARLARLAAGEESVEAVASEIGLDGSRQRAIRWLQQNASAEVPELFSLAEAVILGRPDSTDRGAVRAFDAWGGMALQTYACVCTRLVPPRYWRLLSGRPQLGLMAGLMADLNLRVAEVFAELGLPAALAPHVLSIAAQDFIDAAAPTDQYDWLALSRTAKAVSRVQIEDYVAAMAVVGGPLVPTERGDSRP
jgi:hypothetical protein